MNYILLTVSVFTSVLYNVLLNLEGKRGGRKGKELYLFNLLIYTTGFLLLLLLAAGKPLSLYSVLFGVLFGCVTVLGSICKIRALANGPMHITVLCTTSSMILPAVSGIWISGDTLSAGKLVCIAGLLFFLYLSMDRAGDSRINRVWFLYVLVSFFSQGAVGVMQKLHQASAHAEESAGFLAAAFFCSALFSGVMLLLPEKNGAEEDRSLSVSAAPGRRKQLLLTAVLCGVCIFAMNEWNLLLAGRIPALIFFPVQNGAVLLLNALAAILLYRETLSKRQCVGLCGGILSLVFICIL